MREILRRIVDAVGEEYPGADLPAVELYLAHYLAEGYGYDEAREDVLESAAEEGLSVEDEEAILEGLRLMKRYGLME